MQAVRHSQSLGLAIVVPIACLTLLAGRGTCAADEVRILDCGYEALAARIDLVSAAVSTVHAAYLEISDDDTSRHFLNQLRCAARRGVQVRVLVDSGYNMLPASTVDELIADGVELCEFHPPRWTKPHWISFRMHDKLLVVDSQAMIVGGRNMSADYFRTSSTAGFRDRDVLVTGSAAIHADAYFLRLWQSSHVRRVPSLSGGNRRLACRLLPGPPNLLKLCLSLKKVRLPSFNTGTRHSCHGGYADGACGLTWHGSACILPEFTVSPESIRFVHSNRFGIDPHCDLTGEMLNLIRCSSRIIVIETPYLVLSKKCRRELATAAARGVEVHLVTNSTATTNQILAQAGYVNQKRALLRLGFQLWEYQGPGCLHAKCSVVDDHAVIGSHNLDPRSELYDTQTSVIIRDPGVAAALLACIVDDMIEHSLPVSCDGNARAADRRKPGRNLLRPVWMHALRPAALLLERQSELISPRPFFAASAWGPCRPADVRVARLMRSPSRRRR